jgi:hypothetical protein
LAPDGTCGQIKRVVKNQPATWIQFVVAQIEGLGESDRADEVRFVAQKLGINRGICDFDVSLG